MPPIVYRSLVLLKNDRIIWSGDFSSWSEVNKSLEGYTTDSITETVLHSARKVRDTFAKFERDSFLFYEQEYNYPLLTAIGLGVQTGQDLKILDFGGGLGSLYFQHRDFLNTCYGHYCWTVIELPDIVRIGKEEFEDNRLKFCYSLDDYSDQVSVLVLSSVVQYLEDPYSFLDSIVALKYSYIFIDRTGFCKSPNKTRLTIQRVPECIYKASYPCWFLDLEKVKRIFRDRYDCVFDFDALDTATVPSEYKGFLFKLR